jgi:hypothetical protein
MKTLQSLVLISTLLVGATPVFAGDDRLERALRHLNEAREELLHAEYGRPEHKEKAVKAVDFAIHQVEEARHH